MLLFSGSGGGGFLEEDVEEVDLVVVVIVLVVIVLLLFVEYCNGVVVWNVVCWFGVGSVLCSNVGNFGWGGYGDCRIRVVGIVVFNCVCVVGVLSNWGVSFFILVRVVCCFN